MTAVSAGRMLAMVFGVNGATVVNVDTPHVVGLGRKTLKCKHHVHRYRRADNINISISITINIIISRHHQFSVIVCMWKAQCK